MRIVTVVSLLFVVSDAKVKELLASRTGDEQHAMDSVAEKLIDKLVDKMFDLVMRVSPLNCTDLDSTTLVRPRRLTMPLHLSCPFMTSCVASPFLQGERFRPASKVMAQGLSASESMQQLLRHEWPAIGSVTATGLSATAESSVVHRRFKDLEAFVVNRDSPHRIALAMGPDDGLPFSVGVEVLPAGSRTVMDVNPGYELFFVLSGSLEAYCLQDEEAQGDVPRKVTADAGDVVLFPPRKLHTIEVTGRRPCHMLTFMLDPHGGNVSRARGTREWVEWVRRGTPVGPLTTNDFQAMHPQRERTSPTSGSSKFRDATKDNVNEEGLHWPAQRSPLKLKRKHMRSAEGVAAVPTNALSLIFHARQLPFNFALEDFSPGHVTPVHRHDMAHELFYILSGEGVGSCNGESFPVSQGDFVVFPAGVEHGLDNPSSHKKLYALELMVPSAEVAPDDDRWDYTCLLDGTTGRFLCSELGFGEAIEGGRDAEDLQESDACGFVNALCAMPHDS